MNIRNVLQIVLAAASTPAFSYDYTERVPVIDAVPVYETVRSPQRECWTETVTRYETPARSNGGSIVGAVAGGLLGAQVGKGNCRVAAAAAGAAIGALVGDRMDNGYRAAYPVARPVERCRVSEAYSEELAGYRVTYRHRGRDATVMLPYDPGSSLLIGVEVADAEQAPAAYVLPPSREYRPVAISRVIYLQHDDDYDDGNKRHKHKRGKHKGKWKGDPHWY
jgi:uncharacterized protein YcfJ